MAKRKGISGGVSAQIIVLRGEDENGDDIEVTVNVSGYFDAGQDGGWDDPSWSACVELETFETEDGTAIELTEQEQDEAREALWSVVRGE